jgi:hypothetical protein
MEHGDEKQISRFIVATRLVHNKPQNSRSLCSSANQWGAHLSSMNTCFTSMGRMRGVAWGAWGGDCRGMECTKLFQAYLHDRYGRWAIRRFEKLWIETIYWKRAKKHSQLQLCEGERVPTERNQENRRNHLQRGSKSYCNVGRRTMSER